MKELLIRGQDVEIQLGKLLTYLTEEQLEDYKNWLKELNKQLN